MLKTLISENITIIFVRFLINGLFLFRYEEEFDGFGVRHIGLGIAEFVMMGILPDVAKDLHISIPQAGHFISAYALGVCVGAPGWFWWLVPVR